MVGHSDCNNQQSWQIVSLCGDPCSCLYRAFPLGSTYLINLNLNFPSMILSSVNLVYISERKFLLSVRFR